MASNLTYLKIDFESHKSALIQRVRSRWPTVWNDFMAGSLGILLIDIIAWSTATLAFVINRAAAENFITTMTLRESAIRLGAFAGYNLRGPSPSTLLCEATLQNPAVQPVTISQGTLVRAGLASLPFEVQQNYTINAGNVAPENSIVTFGAGLSGSNVVSSNVTTTGGSAYVDVVDTTVDLTQLVQIGQTFRQTPAIAGEQIYTIQSIESAPGAASNNRMVIAPAWSGQIANTVDAGVTSAVPGEVYDRRIALIQGQTIMDSFVTPGVESPCYTLKLSMTPVIDDSASVTVNGELWSQVTSVMVESGDSQVYQVKTLPSGETVIQFGDGTFGSVVPTEAAITATYRVGGGTAGNIGIGTVNTTITASSGNTVLSVPLTNAYAAGEGGQDPETLDEARASIPAFIQTNDRAVTIKDYQTIAQGFSDPQYGSVTYARASTSTANSLLQGNIVNVCAWATGADGLVPLQPQLQASLQSYLQSKAVGTDYVMVINGENVIIPLSLRFMVSNGFDVFTVQTMVSSMIDSVVSELVPGETLGYSGLLTTIAGVNGVASVDMATPISDIIPTNPLELLTAPNDSYNYVLDAAANSDGVSYTSQMPAAPLRAWSFAVSLNGTQITVIPDVVAGQARLVCDSVLNPNYSSVVNLWTGVVTWYPVISGSQLSVNLISVQGYNRVRPVNLYVGYTGDLSQAKRQAVRAALQEWSSNLQIGGSIFAGNTANAPTYSISGIPASLSNVAAVVYAVGGITSISRVALGSPSSTDTRVTAMAYEMLQVSNIVLNNNNY